MRLRAAISAACHDLLASRSPLADAADLVSGAQRQRHDAADLRAELRAAVDAHVRSLRTGGLPAERVVVMVKGIVRESTPEGLDVGEARDLMEDVVRWSIEVFYAT